MTDTITIVPPTSLHEWTQICVTYSLSDINAWYEDTSVNEIDRWIIPNFQALIDNEMILISSVRVAYDVVGLLNDFDGYVANKEFHDQCDVINGIIVPKVVIGILYNINITGDHVWKAPTPKSHHDWFIEFSDIHQLRENNVSDSVNILKNLLSHASKKQGTHVTDIKVNDTLCLDNRRSVRVETLFFREKRS